MRLYRTGGQVWHRNSQEGSHLPGSAHIPCFAEIFSWQHEPTTEQPRRPPAQAAWPGSMAFYLRIGLVIRCHISGSWGSLCLTLLLSSTLIPWQMKQVLCRSPWARPGESGRVLRIRTRRGHVLRGHPGPRVRRRAMSWSRCRRAGSTTPTSTPGPGPRGGRSSCPWCSARSSPAPWSRWAARPAPSAPGTW